MAAGGGDPSEVQGGSFLNVERTVGTGANSRSGAAGEASDAGVSSRATDDAPVANPFTGAIHDAPDASPSTSATEEERRFRALVAYDGGRFHGWQFQPGLSTIQGEIERAIAATTARTIRVAGAGRTDAGVHALGQVSSFTLRTRLAPDRLRMALNAHLPPEIRIHACEEAPVGFSARQSARFRRYQYVLARRDTPFLRGRAYVPRVWPDLEAMQTAAALLPRGERDFRSLTTQPEGPYGCRLDEARWETWDLGYLFTIRASRFLYQMVRILVGTFLEIGRGRRPPEAMPQILAAQNRSAAGPLAPAHGLYLVEVGYDPPWPVADLPSVKGAAGEIWPPLEAR